MKNSFYLVIPKQQANNNSLISYDKVAISKWLSELPTANPSLSTRLFFDLIEELNHTELSVQKRLDVLELLRPQFLSIKNGLISRLISTGFPKSENELKVFDLLISLEKNFTLGYWIAVRELTRRSINWLQGKNVALAIQRTIKGLSGIVVNHYMMFSAVPDWVWIDLHSLYKLSVKNKKDTTKIPDESSLSGKQSSPEDCYKQILMLSLTDSSGLMQKEMQQVYNFIGKVSQYVEIEDHPINNQYIQCIILMDEDRSPYFTTQKNPTDNSAKYLNLNKVYKALEQENKYCNTNQDEARFSSMLLSTNESEKLPIELFQYVIQRWKGVELKGAPLFADRLDRYIAVGLGATHTLQDSNTAATDDLEILVESYSETELSCKFEKDGILSIGSLVSYRKAKDPENKRSLGLVIKKTIPKQNGQIIFELSALASHSYAVSYQPIDAEKQSEHKNALLYAIKTKKGEKSYILMDSFMYKDGDVMRMYMNDEDFPIILGGRRNVGLGYWQFECRRIEEKQVEQEAIKKGYDFL